MIRMINCSSGIFACNGYTRLIMKQALYRSRKHSLMSRCMVGSIDTVHSRVWRIACWKRQRRQEQLEEKWRCQGTLEKLAFFYCAACTHDDPQGGSLKVSARLDVCGLVLWWSCYLLSSNDAHQVLGGCTWWCFLLLQACGRGYYEQPSIHPSIHQRKPT